MIIDADDVCIKDLNVRVGDILICHDTTRGDKWQELILSVVFNMHGEKHFDYPNVKIMYFLPSNGYKGTWRHSLKKKITWLKYIVRAE